MKATMYKVTARVIKQEGYCDACHKVGDEFIIGDKTPDGLCAHAYQAIFPFAMGYRYGAHYRWDADDSKTTLACPDHDNQVIFELTRVEEK
jgi:uncharacterized repeat protein (TIGR04076 family)